MGRKIVILAALLLAAAVSSDAGGGQAGLLPGEAGRWTAAGSDETYTAETLYDYIDGAAEIYRAFNVRKVVSRRYTNPGAADIVVDLFDMGSPADAYGAYRFDTREGESAGIGRESEIVGSSLAFWKDRYFVSITPFDDRPDIREAVRDIGRSIAAAVERDGAPPSLVESLPKEHLVAGQVHFFRDRRILGLFVPLRGDGDLGLGPRTEGLLARYRLGGGEGLTSLLLLLYPSEERARDGAGRLEEALSPQVEGGVSERRQGGAVLKRYGSLLVAVLGAPSRGDALDLAAELDPAAAGSGEGGP